MPTRRHVGEGENAGIELGNWQANAPTGGAFCTNPAQQIYRPSQLIYPLLKPVRGCKIQKQ
jgi:hypothetical protein